MLAGVELDFERVRVRVVVDAEQPPAARDALIADVSANTSMSAAPGEAAMRNRLLNASKYLVS